MNLSGARIAITGATGFLGGYLVDALRARGAHVVAVVRNPAKARGLAEQGVEVRKADVDARAALVEAFRGVDAVVHNAGVIAFTRPAETMRTNAEGTRNVFEALAQAGVRRALLISSASAYPASFRTLSEADPLRRGSARALLSSYGESKARAEHIAVELSAKHGIAFSALRPCGITGPDDPLLIPALGLATRFPIALLPVFTKIGVVHAGDVAEAACMALARDKTGAFNLQGHTVSLWRLARMWAALDARRARWFIPLPAPFSLRYDDQRARRELGFVPRSLDQILAEAHAATGAPAR